ncbi:hypothetical protein [Chryseobacterium sp. POE27]|uniref:hypothetical protein n=1 Tax=Chryseobacterium sp. POE27 TaxID=3138177 RepID=UPI00321A39AF
MNYKEVTTQKEYKNLLNELSVESKNFADKYPQVPIYKSIYNQINDIKNTISNNIRLSENEIYERYSIGAIAIKNFDCDQKFLAENYKMYLAVYFNTGTCQRNKEISKRCRRFKKYIC